MATFAYHMGLGGIFRDTIIIESDVVSCWPLAEIDATTARDILFDRNPGTWTSTSGLTRGVSVDLPEGALGCTFDGTGYVLVPHDGEGYRMAGDSGPRNLSCAGGDIDVFFLMKTSTNDATLRAIVQKQTTNSSGIGWHVALQNGFIEFYVRVAAGVVCSFQRGAVADDAWHLIQCYYSSSGEARIFIDGVQSGATVTFSADDPETSTGNLRIGKFNDGAGGFIGTLSYVTVSRAGNVGLSAILQACRAWTDVTASVRDAETELIGGLPGTSLRDRMAGVGTLAYSLDNGARVAQGYHTIGHANQRAGFDLGIPVKYTVGSLIKFRGRLLHANPEPNTHKAMRTFCLAGDWFEVCARQAITQMVPAVNIRSDRAFARLIDAADYPPPAVSLMAGAETLPYVFDRVDGPILQEMANVVTSEAGYAYIRPDATTGGVVCFESRGTRLLDDTIHATFSETMVDLEVELGESNLVNVVRSTLTPRTPDASTTSVLYRQEDIKIGPGETAHIESSYQDPGQSRSAIGGADFQALAAGTDYIFTSDPAGAGTVLTSNLSIQSVLGGSGFYVTVTNPDDAAPGYLTLQVRGRIVYIDIPVTMENRNESSVRTRGRRPYDVTYPYLNDTAVARGLADLPLQLFSSPVALPSAVTFRPPKGSALETTVLALSIGDLIAVGETMSGLDTTTHLFYIQNERWLYAEPGRAEVTFGLFPAYQAVDTPFAEWDATNWDESYWGI